MNAPSLHANRAKSSRLRAIHAGMPCVVVTALLFGYPLGCTRSPAKTLDASPIVAKRPASIEIADVIYDGGLKTGGQTGAGPRGR
jgi:hypothetical protein